MPATPAWPAQSAPRLFVQGTLSNAAEVRLDGNNAHYLLNVMRLKIGDAVMLFDDVSGEYLARVSAVGKRDIILAVEGKTRPREAVPDVWLCIAPIKKDRIDMVAEKACELGVDRLVPVLTRRTVVDRINADRLHRNMIEAAEQCHRTSLPHIDPLVKLPAMLRDWPAGRVLYFADETGGTPFADVLADSTSATPAAILIGPEGGFDEEERALIRAHPMATPINLGPRILRAETAAIAALAIWMAHAGDWR
jgi:16S rRNA (uracil1498-N3)-methyltransferase